jgi:hypothetical protein
MTILSQDETYQLLERFPFPELSYETIPHKKVSPSYNICLAIPQGKKGFLWFTYYGEDDICFFMELNRDKKISKVTIIEFPGEIDSNLYFGTILYGSLVEIEQYIPIFVIEDIFQNKGITMKNLLFSERLVFIEQILDGLDKTKELENQEKTNLKIAIPPIWSVQKTAFYECEYDIPQLWKPLITNFQIHHIQYRCLNDLGPYMNVFNSNSILTKKPIYIPTIQQPLITNYRMDTLKPQYRLPTTFLVSADIQFDIYHLYAFGKGSQHIYYNIAYIPSYDCSKMMNNIFRKIKENKNLDYIEESDDEEDFEDTREDKYVDLQKIVQIECIFSQKFKRWVPKRIVQGKKIVHISLL